MSAQPRDTKAGSWTVLEGHVVDGVFPLRRFLGSSNHSAVFLTEYKSLNVTDAAIKFIRADTSRADARLLQWQAAASLPHPHLLRLFHAGRCQFGGRGFLFVVMEYAEQTLAQVLASRALSPAEVREMLPPTLDALAYLHQNHRVHGHLKASNVLAVNDQLKLSSDTIRASGHSSSGAVKTTLYPPPELREGRVSAASDIWSLGITLTEALTQRAPTWADERSETVVLPANFPAQFTATVQRCLSRDPESRPTAVELADQYAAQAPTLDISDDPSPVREARQEAPAPGSFGGTKLFFTIVAGALLIFIAAWMVLRSP